MADDDTSAPPYVDCSVYTHARRHPMVLGKIGGWTLPVQVTLSQVAVIVGSFFVMTQTWRWWGRQLPSPFGLIVAVGLPCVLAWALRRARVEGRSMVRYLLGWTSLMTVPWRGVVGGRAYHPRRRRAAGWVYVEPGEIEESQGDGTGSPETTANARA